MKIINKVIIGFLIVLLVEILFYRVLVTKSVEVALDIWIHNLLPTMFPFFVISDLLIYYDITNYIPNIIKKTFCKWFRVRESVMTIFLLSCFTGFPSNARNTSTLYKKGDINLEEAKRALMFTHFSNPMFILATVTNNFLNLPRYGFIILISHGLGNILIGLFSRSDYSDNNDTNYTPSSLKSQNFSKALIQAIKSSLDTILLIFGTLTCFLIVANLLIENLNLPLYEGVLIKGILEITMGIQGLAMTNLSATYKIVITTMFLSFGGLSVHLQVISQLVDTDIPYYPYFASRVIHTLLSGVIAIILCSLFV